MWSRIPLIALVACASDEGCSAEAPEIDELDRFGAVGSALLVPCRHDDVPAVYAIIFAEPRGCRVGLENLLAERFAPTCDEWFPSRDDDGELWLCLHTTGNNKHDSLGFLLGDVPDLSDLSGAETDVIYLTPCVPEGEEKQTEAHVADISISFDDGAVAGIEIDSDVASGSLVAEVCR